MSINIMFFIINLSYFPTLDSSFLAGEVDAECDYFSFVHCEGSGIVFLLLIVEELLLHFHLIYIL